MERNTDETRGTCHLVNTFYRSNGKVKKKKLADPDLCCKIGPSILAADSSCLAEECRRMVDSSSIWTSWTGTSSPI